MRSNILSVGEFLILLSGIIVTLYFLVILRINTVFAWVLFAGWVLTPYVLAAIRGYMLGRVPYKRHVHFLSLLTAVLAGLYLLLDAVYMNPDPQGGLVVLIVPVLQVPIYLVLYFLGMLVVSKRHMK